MSKTDQLIADIKAVIKANGNQEITGDIMQNILVEMVNTLSTSGVVYNLSTITGLSYENRNAARLDALTGQGLTFNYGDTLTYQLENGIFVREMCVKTNPDQFNSSWMDIALFDQNIKFQFRGNSFLRPLLANGSNLEFIVDGQLYLYYKDQLLEYKDTGSTDFKNIISLDFSGNDVIAIIANIDRVNKRFQLFSTQYNNVPIAWGGSNNEAVIVGAIIKNTGGSIVNNKPDYYFVCPELEKLIRPWTDETKSKSLSNSDIVNRDLIVSMGETPPDWSIQYGDDGLPWIVCTFKAGIDQYLKLGRLFSGTAQITFTLQEAINAPILLGEFKTNPILSKTCIITGETSKNYPVYFDQTGNICVGMIGVTHGSDITIKFRLDIQNFDQKEISKKTAVITPQMVIPDGNIFSYQILDDEITAESEVVVSVKRVSQDDYVAMMPFEEGDIFDGKIKMYVQKVPINNLQLVYTINNGK